MALLLFHQSSLCGTIGKSLTTHAAVPVQPKILRSHDMKHPPWRRSDRLQLGSFPHTGLRQYSHPLQRAGVDIQGNIRLARLSMHDQVECSLDPLYWAMFHEIIQIEEICLVLDASLIPEVAVEFTSSPRTLHRNAAPTSNTRGLVPP